MPTYKGYYTAIDRDNQIRIIDITSDEIFHDYIFGSDALRVKIVPPVQLYPLDLFLFPDDFPFNNREHFVVNSKVCFGSVYCSFYDVLPRIINESACSRLASHNLVKDMVVNSLPVPNHFFYGSHEKIEFYIIVP